MGGMGGLDDLMSPTPTGGLQSSAFATKPAQSQPQQQASKADDDLLGLF
jgi:hypothetical protein